MSGVWVFKNGVMRLNDGGGGGASSSENQSSVKKKVLVYLPTGDVVSSYSCLENILTQELGWERYYGDTELLQFHKTTSIDLISLPKDFSKFTSVYMYDIVVKNPNVFRVRES